MQSIPPVPLRVRPRRPLALVACLLLAWTLGVGGLTGGCGTIQFYRLSSPPTLAADEHADQQRRDQFEAMQRARNDALVSNAARIKPLAVANMLLSGLLVVAIARALGLRVRANVLALQALGANAIFAVVDFILARPVRSSMIAAASGVSHTAGTAVQTTIAGWWLYRFGLIGQLVIFALTAWVLTRPWCMKLYARPKSGTN